MIQLYDALDYLALLFAISMTVIFTVGWWISEHWPRRRNRRTGLPAPSRHATRGSIEDFKRVITK